MNEQLLLENVRKVMSRLEDSLIFGLIERAQFAQNEAVYKSGVFGPPVGDDSLAGYLLHETEKAHARVRRYTSPDEHPFYEDLPEPVLTPLTFYENPLRPNSININRRIWQVYEHSFVPLVCAEGDDAQYGSSAVCDVNILQALSRRIHYGKFVAESKYQKNSETYQHAIDTGDRDTLLKLIIDPDVEQKLLRRVDKKTRTFGQLIQDDSGEGGSLPYRIAPEHVVYLYKEWIIPLTKDVQLAYLLTCCKTRKF